MPRLARILDALESIYGHVTARITDPFEMILLENASYLVDDARRHEVVERIRREIGISPAAILRRTPQQIVEVIAAGGMKPEMRAAKVLESAKIAREAGDLRAAIRLDVRSAKKLLRRFPNVGEPYADRILLFNGAQKAFAPDSNALRVVERLGFIREQKNYSAVYRDAVRALDAEIADPPDGLRAHLLLRRHGQELCKRAEPRCDLCTLREHCAYYERTSR
jgi:endonuclease III